MLLLPPSPKPFGVFAERSEVPLAQWEVDLRVSQELEARILASAWTALLDKVIENMRIHGIAYYEARWPIKYFYQKMVL